MKLLLIIAAIYFGFKYIITPYILPVLLKYLAGKATEKFTGGFNQQQREQQHKPEGSVTIDKNVKQNSKLDTSVAEDVDFEEVE